MLTPSSITLAQGQTGTVTVSTALVSGIGQLLTFSMQGLPPVIPSLPPFNFSQAQQFTLNPPPGIKSGFAPPQAPVGTDTVLTLVVGNVPPGNYPTVQVVVTGPYGQVTANLNLTITASTFSV